MRTILALSIFLFLFSCKKEEVLDCTDINYNETITAKYRDKFCLENGFEFEIVEVVDGYCPCNVVCIHPGFLSVKIDLIDNQQIKHNLQVIDASFALPDMVPSIDNFIPSFKNVKIVNDDCSNPAKPENITFDLIIKEK